MSVTRLGSVLIIAANEGKFKSAEEGTRTPILFTGLEPESSVSTNFTTSA